MRTIFARIQRLDEKFHLWMSGVKGLTSFHDNLLIVSHPNATTSEWRFHDVVCSLYQPLSCSCLHQTVRYCWQIHLYYDANLMQHTCHVMSRVMVFGQTFHCENMPIQIYWKFYKQRKENCQIKNSDIFHIPAKNIDRGYSLEPPHRGGSNESLQCMFLSRS